MSDAPELSATQTVPASPPRDVTPAASRRAWHEPRVHFWWIVALALLAAAATLAVQQYRSWSSDAQLIKEGTRVEAVVWPSGARVKGRPIGVEDPVLVTFPWNGQDFEIPGRRFSGVGDGMLTGTPIPIYVDPQNPTRYTARAAPPPLARQLIGPILLAGIAALLVVVAIIRRAGVLAVWKRGEAQAATVVETKQTALAPRSRLVRCTLTAGADRRVIDVYVPHRAATPQPGDALWLIMPPGRPEKALAAMLYR